MEEIILDRRTFRALAIDTRVNILKALRERRKTASELSKQLALSVPTITEHLEKMQEAGLVKKEKQGKKWMYYALSEKGSRILSPKLSSVFVFALSVAVVLMLIGSLNIFTLVGTPVYYDKTIIVPGEKVSSYSYEDNRVQSSVGNESEDSVAAIEEKEQTQTITEMNMSYSREISYEYLGVLIMGLGIFIFLIFFHRQKLTAY